MRILLVFCALAFLGFMIFLGNQDAVESPLQTDHANENAITSRAPAWYRGESVDEMTDIKKVFSSVRSLREDGLSGSATLWLDRICPHANYEKKEITASLLWPDRSSTLPSSYSYNANVTLRFDDLPAQSVSLGSNYRGTFFNDNQRRDLYKGAVSSSKLRVRTISVLEGGFQLAEFGLQGISEEVAYLEQACEDQIQ